MFENQNMARVCVLAMHEARIKFRKYSKNNIVRAT